MKCPVGSRAATAWLAASWLLAAGSAGASQDEARRPAQDPAAPAQPAASALTDATTRTRVRDDGRRTLRRFPASLLRGTIGVFHKDNLAPVLIGGGATGVGSLFDDDVRDSIADPRHSFGKSLEDGADPAVMRLAILGLFTVGRFANGPRFRAMTYDLLDATLVNYGYTTLIKEAVGRERPDGSDKKSFPSGHASNAFALAAVVERHYGWKAGVPAYALASAVAASRLQRNKHYLSDVLAGATLGYVVGRTVVRVNGRPLDAPRGPQVGLTPVIGSRTRALLVSIAY